MKQPFGEACKSSVRKNILLNIGDRVIFFNYFIAFVNYLFIFTVTKL